MPRWPYRRVMPPVGLLAIIALGMVLAYVLPQRMRERAEYALVRTEDRYSADMRVVKTTARRVEADRAARRESTSGEVPLLVTGAARASVAGLGASHLSRPATPLDRAATLAQRERLALRRDRSALLAERKAQARRRARVALGAATLAAVSWILVAATAFPALVAAIATAAFAGITVAGARAAHAQRVADSHVLAVAREVEAAATATQALRRVSRERAQGHEAEPSDLETQAIKVVTAENLAPLSAPAPLPKPELPGVRTDAHETVETGSISRGGIVDGDAFAEDDGGWSPQEMPAPAYTLKPTVRQRPARPIDDEDYSRSAAVAERWVDSKHRVDERQPREEAKPAAASGTLDAILARRRQASA